MNFLRKNTKIIKNARFEEIENLKPLKTTFKEINNLYRYTQLPLDDIIKQFLLTKKRKNR